MESLYDEICDISIARYEERRILEEEEEIIQQLQRRLEEDRGRLRSGRT